MSDEPEVLVCDTTFFSLTGQIGTHPERFQHWPAEAVRRIDRAVLAISVITIAEVRAGMIAASWGEARVRREEHRMTALLRLPLDNALLSHWAELRAATRQAGAAIGDNDLWIAATAQSRDLAVVTCDRDFLALESLGISVLYLARTAESG